MEPSSLSRAWGKLRGLGVGEERLRASICWTQEVDGPEAPSHAASGRRAVAITVDVSEHHSLPRKWG